MLQQLALNTEVTEVTEVIQVSTADGQLLVWRQLALVTEVTEVTEVAEVAIIISNSIN